MTGAQNTEPQPKSGLVWLASYPKSGNTWTRAFLANLAWILEGEPSELDVNSIGRFTVGENFTEHYRNRLGFEPTATEDHRKRIAALRHVVQQEDIADKFEGLVFVKTHNALAIDRGHSLINFAVTAGAIYIVRNPLDVAISLSYHVNRSIDQAIDALGQYLETDVNEKRVHEVWDTWSNHVLSWTSQAAPSDLRHALRGHAEPTRKDFRRVSQSSAPRRDPRAGQESNRSIVV